jgi:hypothetical protein
MRPARTASAPEAMTRAAIIGAAVPGKSGREPGEIDISVLVNVLQRDAQGRPA